MSKPKPKIKKEAVLMPKQDPKVRIHNFNEVAHGYTEEQAVAEAERCLQCAKAPCIDGCPVEVDISEFIQLIRERKFDEAINKVKEKNSLPAICGRVCPQEAQCQASCTMGKVGDPISIGDWRGLCLTGKDSGAMRLHSVQHLQTKEWRLSVQVQQV